MNKKHPTGTLPVNKERVTCTVPVNKKHLTGTLKNSLKTKIPITLKVPLSEDPKVPELCPEVEENPEPFIGKPVYVISPL